MNKEILLAKAIKVAQAQSRLVSAKCAHTDALKVYEDVRTNVQIVARTSKRRLQDAHKFVQACLQTKIDRENEVLTVLKELSEN